MPNKSRSHLVISVSCDKIRTYNSICSCLADGKFIAMNETLKRAPAFETMETRMVGEVTRNMITQRAESDAAKATRTKQFNVWTFETARSSSDFRGDPE